MAAHTNNLEILISLYNRLLIERDTMNKFFDVFLDMYSLSTSNRNSPLWIAYDKKFAEYAELTSNINTAKYYLEINNVI